MTPAEAARAVADDYDLIGDPSAEWMATAWRRFADKLDPPPPEHYIRANNCVHNSHVPGFYDDDAICERCR
jgi:hypothetical protein